MKYQVDQSVILLDTEFKPTVLAIIKEINLERVSYLVEYQLPNLSEPDTIWVPQERLNQHIDKNK